MNLIKYVGKLTLFVMCLMGLSSNVSATDGVEAQTTTILNALVKAKFKQKEQLVDELVQLNADSTVTILAAFLDSRLYYKKKTKEVFIIQEQEDTVELYAPLTNELVANATKRELKKISTNNGLRKKIRGAIAGLRIMHPSSDVRLAAIEELITSPDSSLYPALAKQYATEADDAVKSQIAIAMATLDLDSGDDEKKIEAIKVLGGSLYPQIAGQLNRMLEQNADGEFTESQLVRDAAYKAVRDIESSIGFYEFIKDIFFGLSLGSILLLTSVGLAITFGVMGVINMAHGEMMMLGAYTTYVIQQYIMPNMVDYSLLVAVPMAFIVTAIIGIAIERGIIKHLYGRPLETLLATFGISLVLQQLVRTIFGPLNQVVIAPSWMQGSWVINPAFELTFNRLYIVVFALALFGLLIWVMKKTSFGLQMRAVTQNREMARAVGIRSNWVDAMTFGLGSGIAGIAGVALSQLTNVGPNLGQGYIIDSFMVVVFGGVGNLFGTFFGAMTLGVANKFIEGELGAVLAKILILVFIIVFIQRRPRGMFALKGRAVEG